MAVSDYLKGAGTSGDPYIIHNKTAMIEWLMVGCGAAKFALIVTDIDMEGYIASTGRPDWKGYLDGCGYTVKNLDFNGQKNFTGEIKKIAFENIRTRSNQVYAGNGGSISDVAFIGGISAGSFIWTYGTIMTRVVSNSPIPIYAETSGSSGVYALPGSGGMGSRSTDLRNHPTPYATSNFSLLTSYPLFWAVDGGSMPRLLKQDRLAP